MDKTRVFLVRHGTTTLSSEDRFAGATDVDLSEEGRRQARELARRFAAERFAQVYCSPMKRTRETAAIATASLGLTPVSRDELREIDHGHWEGMRRSDVEASYGDEYSAWEEDPFTFAPKGGESGIQVLARVLPLLREIVKTHHGSQVLVVSHKATIRLLISSVLGFDPRDYRDRLDQLPCCLNILDFNGPVRARLTLFNDVSHYVQCPPPPASRLSRWWG